MRKRRQPAPSLPGPSELQLAVEMAEIVAHEVNNLLNNILLNVAVLDRKGLDNARSELAAIRAAGNGAGTLVNRWQQLNPRRPTALEATSLNSLVKNAVASWQPPGPGIQVRFRPAKELPPILAHPEEVGRLVGLLLDHAAAAAGSGTIQVRTEKTEGEVRLAVADCGPSIEPALLDRVFDPFFTARPLRGADLDPGKELGLTLSKKLARRQQGRIEAQNPPEGGVRVVVSFRTVPQGAEF